MSISTQTTQTLSGLFKEVYVGKLESLVSPENKLLQDIEFDSANKNGGNYTISVLLNREHGITFLGTDAQPQNLRPGIGSVVKQAQIKASSAEMLSQLTNQAASRAVTSKQAFADATKYMVQSLLESHQHYQEMVHWAGSYGLATFTGATAVLAVNQIQIDAAAFAPGFWRGGESAQIDIYDSAKTTKILTTEITAVDIENRKLTLASVLGLSNGTSYVIFAAGARNNESRGIESIMKETGDLFGINATTYERWKPNNYAAGSSKLDYSVWSSAFAQAQGRGLGIGGKELMGLVSHLQFRNLIPDMETLASGSSTATKGSRRLNSAGDVRMLEHGTEKITFLVGNIRTTIEANSYIKNGLAFFLDKATWKRVGSAEVGFNTPSVQDDGQYFRPVPLTNYYSIHTFSDESIFCNNNARNLLISGLGV